jgi:hypothetical protein
MGQGRFVVSMIVAATHPARPVCLGAGLFQVRVLIMRLINNVPSVVRVAVSLVQEGHQGVPGLHVGLDSGLNLCPGRGGRAWGQGFSV